MRQVPEKRSVCAKDAAEKKKNNKNVAYGKQVDDANHAGKKNKSNNCTLYITEGLSAKTFASPLPIPDVAPTIIAFFIL